MKHLVERVLVFGLHDPGPGDDGGADIIAA
jgi:hypothetical protein